MKTFQKIKERGEDWACVLEHSPDHTGAPGAALHAQTTGWGYSTEEGHLEEWDGGGLLHVRAQQRRVGSQDLVNSLFLERCKQAPGDHLLFPHAGPSGPSSESGSGEEAVCCLHTWSCTDVFATNMTGPTGYRESKFVWGSLP